MGSPDSDDETLLELQSLQAQEEQLKSDLQAKEKRKLEQQAREAEEACKRELERLEK